MRDDRERLLDIQEAVERIERYAARGRKAFEQDELIQTWVLYHLQIIGEAARTLARIHCATPVSLVADDGVLHPSEVHANLMRPPRLYLYAEQREPMEATAHAPERQRRAPAATDGHARPVARVARDGLFHFSLLLPHDAVYESNVGLEDRARAELLGKIFVRTRRLRHDDEARRVAVEPVDYARSQRARLLGELFEVKRERVGERA